jgi:hypothetical protein
MAMTSTSVFGDSGIHDPLRGSPPAPTLSKDQILRENIEKFIKGEITGEQLEQIKKSLS